MPAEGSVLSPRQIVSIAPRCPHSPGFYLRCVETGEVRRFRCKRNACEYCLGVNRWQTGRLVAEAEPRRFVLFTLVGNDWQTIRARMGRVFYDLRAEGLRSEWAWFVHENPKGTGHHVHALQHGDYLPLKTLRRVADRRGMGRRVVPEEIRGAQDAAGYAARSAAGYSARESAAALPLNGNRVGHWSRGYWRAPGGKRAAERRMLAKWREREEEAGRTWRLEAEPSAALSSSSVVRTDTGCSAIWQLLGRIDALFPDAVGPSGDG